jgi:metal-sulfur cluster biosynthetic enzyme
VRAAVGPALEARDGLREAVLGALATVHDPELDEPITSLRFVGSCEVTAAGDVDVVLRLPTPQCAPNFAFLMAADARRAVRRLAAVRRVTISLEDHYTAAEINAALAGGQGFAGAFPGETADDQLDGLRERFQRKALTARQGELCAGLLARGVDSDQVCGLRVRDLPETDELRRCLELRAALGIESHADAPAFVLPGGEALTSLQLPRWLRMARLVSTSLQANGGICRGLLAARHQLATEPEEIAR